MKLKLIILFAVFVNPILTAGQWHEKPGDQKPLLFDVNDSAIPIDNIPLIKPWKTVVLDKKYRGGWIVAGDVDNDGAVDIVTARIGEFKGAADEKHSAVGGMDEHYTASVAAHRLDGSVIWKWGNPSQGRNQLFHDVACQIYDWDGDGKNEVIVAAKEALVEIDGATGKEKRRFPIPKFASDCITFCNLSGNKRPTDVLLKTRYSEIWAYDYNGKLLWNIEGPGDYPTAHQARPMDVDSDGKDEIMAGYSLLSSDGTVKWTLNKSQGRFKGHMDCARLFRKGNSPQDSRIILTFCGGNQIASFDGNGLFSWSITGHHFESIDIGKLCPQVAGNQIVVDHPNAPWGRKPIFLLDENGNILGRILTTESRFHRLIDWTGNGLQEIIIGQSKSMFDGQGKKVATFLMPTPPGEQPPSSTEESILCATGDMTGDGITDVIYYTNPGTVVYIYKNQSKQKSENKIPLGMGINYTLY